MAVFVGKRMILLDEASVLVIDVEDDGFVFAVDVGDRHPSDDR